MGPCVCARNCAWGFFFLCSDGGVVMVQMVVYKYIFYFFIFYSFKKINLNGWRANETRVGDLLKVNILDSSVLKAAGCNKWNNLWTRIVFTHLIKQVDWWTWWAEMCTRSISKAFQTLEACTCTFLWNRVLNLWFYDLFICKIASSLLSSHRPFNGHH